jgi:ABC-type taurine transport system ATPase subunit
MKKLVIIGAAVTAALFVAKRRAFLSGGPDFARMVERMPENAPPRWIFTNVSAIRENTEWIMQLLEGQHPSATAEPGGPASSD